MFEKVASKQDILEHTSIFNEYIIHIHVKRQTGWKTSQLINMSGPFFPDLPYLGQNKIQYELNFMPKFKSLGFLDYAFLDCTLFLL